MLLSSVNQHKNRRPSATVSSESVTKKLSGLRASADVTIDKHDATGKTIESDKVTLQRLREAIPPHCFEPSTAKCLYYLGRDIAMVIGFGYTAWNYIPLISSAPLRGLAWMFYGFMQGLVFMGLWTIAHEMGHGSQLPSKLANNILGFIIHTLEGFPYYSFKSVHAKHHRYTAHMEKDPDHVPPRYIQDSNTPPSPPKLPRFAKFLESISDSPIYMMCWLIFQQVLGWPMYLTFSISAGPASAEYKHDQWTKRMPEWLRKSKINPLGSFFRKDEIPEILISDLGVVIFATMLWSLGRTYGYFSVFLMYGQPYMWLNHWLVAITTLNHNHAEVPKYEAEAWTYMKGATAGVDREFPIVARFFFHNIITDHVIHHVFPRLPFYNAPEATAAMKPILGDMYHYEPKNYIACIWREFTKCQYVISDKAENPKDRALWWVGNSSQVPNRDELEKMGIPKRKGGSWRW